MALDLSFTFYLSFGILSIKRYSFCFLYTSFRKKTQKRIYLTKFFLLPYIVDLSGSKLAEGKRVRGKVRNKMLENIVSCKGRFTQ